MSNLIVVNHLHVLGCIKLTRRDEVKSLDWSLGQSQRRLNEASRLPTVVSTRQETIFSRSVQRITTMRTQTLVEKHPNTPKKRGTCGHSFIVIQSQKPSKISRC